jgi:hypothetical protein
LNKLERIEELVGLKTQEWTTETLNTIVDNDETLQLLTEELIVDVLKGEGVDIDVQNILKPIKYSYLSKQVSYKLNEQLEALQQEEITLDVFKENMLNMFEDDDSIGNIGKYLSILLMFDDPKEHIKEEDVLTTIENYVNILEDLDINLGFEVLIGLVDPLIALRELYFQVFEVDIIQDNARINKILRALDEKTEEMYQFVPQEENQENTEE